MSWKYYANNWLTRNKQDLDQLCSNIVLASRTCFNVKNDLKSCNTVKILYHAKYVTFNRV